MTPENRLPRENAVVWRKSRYSGGNGDCVEAAVLGVCAGVRTVRVLGVGTLRCRRSPSGGWSRGSRARRGLSGGRGG
ncbi:DUF397 domain-containing protein [Actinocorallia aurea]